MIAQSVADILRDRVKLSVEGIDRMYLSCRHRHERYWTKPLRGSRVLQSPVERYLIRLTLVRRKQSSHFQ
jgi:hypothetical protein